MWRSLLQSETCSVEIPELEFELGMGALGGKFTTLEGLLKDIKDLVSDPCCLLVEPCQRGLFFSDRSSALPCVLLVPFAA